MFSSAGPRLRYLNDSHAVGFASKMRKKFDRQVKIQIPIGRCLLQCCPVVAIKLCGWLLATGLLLDAIVRVAGKRSRIALPVRIRRVGFPLIRHASQGVQRCAFAQCFFKPFLRILGVAVIASDVAELVRKLKGALCPSVTTSIQLDNVLVARAAFVECDGTRLAALDENGGKTVVCQLSRNRFSRPTRTPF